VAPSWWASHPAHFIVKAYEIAEALEIHVTPHKEYILSSR
jgi:hypothetical protein